MLFADKAVICTNPELSSVRDSDKMIGFISSRAQRAVDNREPVEQSLLITRYNPDRVVKEDMLSVNDIKEMLGIPVCGVIPESPDVLHSINVGRPVILSETNAAHAYKDAVARLLGEERELRYTTPEQKSFFARFFTKE